MQPDRIPIKEYARRLRRRQTQGEKALWPLRFLIFLPQRAVAGRIPDWYSPIWKIAIEVNGSVHKLPHVREADRRKRRAFKRAGIYLINYSDWWAKKAAAVVLVEVLITICLFTTWRGLRWLWPRLMI